MTGMAGLFFPACGAVACLFLPDWVWASSGVFCLVLTFTALGLFWLRSKLILAGLSGLLAWGVYMVGAILAAKPCPVNVPAQTFIFFILWLTGLAGIRQVSKMAAAKFVAEEKTRAAKKKMLDLAREQDKEVQRINKSLFLEIRAHTEAESRLRESEEKYRNLVDSLPEGIFIVQDGKIVFFNPGLETLTGLGPEEIRELEPDRLISGDSKEETPDNGCRTFYLPDNSKIFIESQWVDIRFKDQPALLCAVRNITERVTAGREKKRLEGKLEKAKKMEALGLMAAGVAHDLNNVLAGIVSIPDLLLMELPGESRYDELRETVRTIKDSGKRASVIVDELLTLGKGSVGHREPIRLNEVVREYLGSPEFHRSCEFHPRVRVDTQLDPDLPGMTGSELHMRKVVMNLVSNAMEAIRGEGRVFLSTRRTEFSGILLKGYETPLEGEYIQFTIEDTGPGIAPGDLERIFEPFYTKKILGRSGTGLGLFIVWNIIHDQKGSIQVKSSQAGTCFDIYFPATSTLKEDDKPDRIYTLSDYTGNNEKILVVDDEKNQRKITSNMLRRMGYIVDAVPSGLAAVEYAQENRVDLVVLDMIMAPGIDGFETFKRLRAVSSDVRAVLVSGYSKTPEVEMAQAAGAGAFLKKPFSLQDLGLTVKHELEGQE